MNDDQWGPWRADADPEIGMYVQLKAEQENTERVIIHEFIVVSQDEYEIFTSPPFILNVGDWKLKEWRERKPKGLSILQNILREVEDDGGVGYKEREREDASA